jgi:hypothetical protein
MPVRYNGRRKYKIIDKKLAQLKFYLLLFWRNSYTEKLLKILLIV